MSPDDASARSFTVPNEQKGAGGQTSQALFTALASGNEAYIASLYDQWLGNPHAVATDWQSLFADLEPNRTGASSGLADRAAMVEENKADAAETEKRIASSVADSVRAIAIIRAYRVRGHLAANLDPLGLVKQEPHAELDPANYGFKPEDWDRPIRLVNTMGFQTATLRQIMDRLQTTYCGTIGIEFMHIQDPAQKTWLQERIEGSENHTSFTERGKKSIYERLVDAESFERFFDRKYTGAKRFGLEGGESLIPALEQILKRGSQLGVEEVVIGMPHRGRLNVIFNVLHFPFQAIVSEFQGNSVNPEDAQGTGDVKYHLGTSTDREFDGATVHLSLTANPSHLEAVDPVVVGKVRAKQMQRKDSDRIQVMPLLLHGDAAFAGQGLVAETIALADLRGYRTGGTIHFIVNNQIGFTTAPAFSRFTPYPSDLSKSVQSPIFHVNGDDPEAVVHVSRIATEFRMRFHRDVVIDMFCYRRHGHNEADEPAFTQPLMYKAIAKKQTTREIYGQTLLEQKLMTEVELEAMVKSCLEYYEQEYVAATSYKPDKADWLEGAWSGMDSSLKGSDRGETAVSVARLKQIGSKLTVLPEGFEANKKIIRLLETKKTAIESGSGIDWATAEALAFGSLLAEGVPVRMSGQDVSRGTFSHRHAVIIDQETEARYTPLHHVSDGQASFEIIDSPLAEASVLGFEYGFSLAEPHALVLWEAQFGDFANGAQVIIDQFIASGESKWLRMSGLVMLLPHGMEGQGPEHSSARPERFLQLCAEENMQVVNCTTAANYFHVLRRQVKRSFRKPLIVMSPKSLLRAKQVASDLKEFADGTRFKRIIPETESLGPDKTIRRVILCSGKVYYDLVAGRDKREIKDIAIIRLEEIYPFPGKLLGDELARYPNADLLWCQEEPRNQGYWNFVAEPIRDVISSLDIRAVRPQFIGRKAAAAPATGLLKRHLIEQEEIVDSALRIV
ncbi:MAG: 2-oxoglutarate dehydrogenase E1 component [Candidatus Pacebacteria bacterium]|nr:2-oxoglutarate dehydrogenase E1 component [Candidatus Paceibacterota bacterium]